LAPENNKNIPIRLITSFATGKLAEAAGVWDVVGTLCMVPTLGRSNYPRFPLTYSHSPFGDHPFGCHTEDLPGYRGVWKVFKALASHAYCF